MKYSKSAFALVTGSVSADVGSGLAADRVPTLADQFSKNHDEQLIYDNPATSKNSDGLGL